MNHPRRTFLKTSLAATAAAAFSGRSHAAASGAAPAREYYDLRCYWLKSDPQGRTPARLKSAVNPALLDSYLEKALVPALAKRGAGPVGVFTEIEVNKNAGTSAPKADSPVWVLIPYSSLEAFVTVSAEVNADAAVRQAAAAYLNVPKAAPAFERVDSWLLRAFKSMPKLEQPAFSKTKSPGRVFEMRDYESHSEAAALNKMAMFDDGETEVMRDLGMSPVFFGQALSGPNLPHLRYFTSGPDLAAHLAAWKKFGPDPRWVKMKDDPKYANNTSRNTARFLVPKAFSQL
ncbi:MAG: hypothetical protein B9S34_08965 [Opitutia bacterium Tous-C1TDCM]|nr:MAG: hypothetical protein B9S34_08965 [Opitutae bacterium Tous-C1TDCM]